MTFEGKQLGRYHIVRLLGSGAMGEVYLAEDARIEQQVAVKVIRSERSPFNNPDQVREEERLFQREARAIVKLDHPHILPLYDYGEVPVDGVMITYLVMPYRPDGSLADWLRRRSSRAMLPPRELAHIIGQTADALQHAHNRNVIHQDIKLSNLLVRERADRTFLIDVFLTDFGVARLATGTSAASQAVRGTPSAMAPEQWDGQAVPASDQYALAVMAYELIAGRPPFQGNLRRVMYQHLHETPAPPSTFHAGVPQAVDAVILHALAKKPEDRFASVTAFANAFRQAALGSNASLPLAPEVQGEELATYIQSRPTQDVGELYTMQQSASASAQGTFQAVLAISAEEALHGTSRTIFLTGGRQAMVMIPPNAYDGQIVSVPEPGRPGSALLMSISIVQTGRTYPSAPEQLNTVLTPGSVQPSGVQTPVRIPGDRPTPLPAVAGNPITPLPPVVPERFTPLPSTGSYQPAYGNLHGATTLGQETNVVPLPERRSVSRRVLLGSLVAGATLVAAGGGIAVYELLSHNSSGGNTGTGTQGNGSSTVQALGTTLFTYRGHTDFVYVVRWSPDGARIASGGDDMTVQVWDAFTGRHALSYKGHSSYVYGISWSPNNTLIASGSRDNTVQKWNASTGGQLLVYKGHTNWVNTVDWSPDSKQIASGGNDRVMRVWDANSGVTNSVYPDPAQANQQDPTIQSVAWSHAGDRIAAGNNANAVQVWSASSNGSALVSYQGHTKQVRSVSWSPDDTKIASSGFDGTVHIWSSTTGQHLLTFKGHTFNVNDVSWSPDGKYIASASSDQTVQIWDASTGAVHFSYTGHMGEVQNARWSPDGRSIASAGYDFLVKVWSTGLK